MLLRTGRPVQADIKAEASVMPADGPSFGIAPSGMWTWKSWEAKKSSSIEYAAAWARA